MNDRNMYRPTDLQAFLKEWGLEAKKGLSQNFLIDGNIIEKIVRTAKVDKGDVVLEIGPGPGALTQALLAKGANVLAVEKDPTFAQALSRLQTPDQRLEVAQADILTFPLLEFLQKLQGKKCKVVANLPYHITTPILTRLLPLFETVESLTIMVQKEFAERLSAAKDTSAYSSFTVFVQFYGHLDKTFTVSSHCFYPRPKVDSAVVHCELHPPLLEKNAENFFQLTRTAFGQRRKMLKSSLKSLYGSENVEQALNKIGLSPQSRPENLSIQEFLALYKELYCSRPKSVKNVKEAP